MPANSEWGSLNGLYGGGLVQSGKIPLSIMAAGSTVKTNLTVRSGPSSAANLTLGADTLKDFSYYFDLDRGVACMRKVGSDL